MGSTARHEKLFSLDEDDDLAQGSGSGSLAQAAAPAAGAPRAAAARDGGVNGTSSRGERAPAITFTAPSNTSSQTSAVYSDSHEDATAGSGHATPVYYPPRPLKSTLSSREAAYELDSDEIDHHAGADGAAGGNSSSAFELEGLVHAHRQRSSVDGERQGGSAVSAIADVLGSKSLDSGAGIWAGVAVMSNSILGAGIVGLPYALRESGMLAGLLLLVALGAVTDWTIRLIVVNAKLSGQSTYIGIMNHCFGQWGRALVSFFQLTFAFGGMCAFGVIIGDTLPHVLAFLFLPGSSEEERASGVLDLILSRSFVTIVCTMGISYPLSLYRDIEKLSKASALALFSMVIIVVSVAIRGPAVDEYLRGTPSERFTILNTGFFEGIGVISFAFVCHHNSLLIYGSLRTPTLDRFARVTHFSTMLSVVACLCMAIAGYWNFVELTKGNILNNFDQADGWINIARACFGVNMFTTLPLELFVCREVLEMYFWPPAPGQPPTFNYTRHVTITTCLILASLTVSLMTCDLGVVLELAGGFAATALAYIFPAACYLKLTSPTRHAVSAHAFEALPTSDDEDEDEEQGLHNVDARAKRRANGGVGGGRSSGGGDEVSGGAAGGPTRLATSAEDNDDDTSFLSPAPPLSSLLERSEWARSHLTLRFGASGTAGAARARARAASWICAAFGACVLVLSTALSVAKALSSEGGGKQC